MGLIRAAAILTIDNGFRTPRLELKCLGTSFGAKIIYIISYIIYLYLPSDFRVAWCSIYPPTHDTPQKTDHNTGNYMPYSLRQVCGFFYVPLDYEYCETGPTVYRPYPRRLESLTICGCNYKGSAFSSVI